jgi:hypothetical protein
MRNVSWRDFSMVGARATCRVPLFSLYSVAREYTRTDSEDTLPTEVMYRL